MSDDDLAGHWDSAYAEGETSRSWYQEQPTASLELFEAVGVRTADPVIDVGGGASPLVDALLGRGFADVTVLDISATGIAYAQDRLGDASGRVHWLVADVLTWRAPRHYRVWHDRAVFHFLTNDEAKQHYLRTLAAATEEGSLAVIGCFAPDGPTQCSGLPVARYDAVGLAETLGSRWTPLVEALEEHRTPGGAVQPFTWVVFRREGG